ncbi:MAG: starch-binding protein [Alistipes sp.]|nr:starch-binding protein [Alistipes sp.]
MKKLLSILALALAFVACQNEPGLGEKNGDLANVVLSIEAPELATRADSDANAGKNSAFGAIDFFNDADWANYDVRYILEVYDANDDGTGEPIYRERLVNYLDKYAPTQFELRLVPNREYKFAVFADFVNHGTTTDLFYDTTDLRNVTAKTGAEGWNAMNEVRDAYYVSENVEVSTSLNKTLTLTRPFGKVRVIATDLDYIAGYSAPGYVEVKYHTEALYNSFNAVNGNLNTTTLAGDELVYSYDVKKDAPYTEGYDAEAKNQTLFADYLFAREGQQMPINFEMSVYESKGGRLIKTTDFNTQIPVQRNYLTTITGDILTTQANITIVVNDDFVDELINPSMEKPVDAPAVTATVEGNTVTLKWDEVEGAVKYYTRRVAEGNVAFEETAECTKVYENLAWETEYTFEVYAVSEKGIVSKTTVVTATTEKEPIKYNIYLRNEDNWDAVYFFAWGDDFATIDWPGEEMTKTTVDEVEYYVYTLPSEVNGKTINFLFNNGNNGKQTADIEGIVINKDHFYTNYVEPQPSNLVLYLKPNANWKVDNARFAAYFFGAGETWADMTLVEGETDIYSVDAPAGYPNVIFCRMNPSATDNNWNNKWNQTADLTVPTDGTNLYIVKENTWDNGGGTWSVYTPAVVEPEVLATPVVEAEVEGNVVTLTWEAVENAAQYGITVGTEMPVFVEETTYVFTGEYETKYTFNVVAVPEDETKFAVSEAAVATATTEAEPAEEVVYTTVAEFLAAAEDESETAPMYTLKGTITAVANTSYGNFDLTDDTGTVYIYGLMSPDGATNKYWATSGAKLGDDIVVKTVRTSFNGTAQGKNAWFVELVSPGTRAFYTIDPAAVDFESAGGEQDIEVFAYNTTASVTATSDNDAFTVAVNGYVVTVTAAANELEEKVTGNITIKVGDLEPTVVKATLAAKPASGVIEGGSDDFHTISATNTSYVTGKTTAGWNYTNCAIFKGGTSDNSPAFKMIGENSNRALCMNGKTSAVGTITSPVFSTGCGTLKFNYGLPFSDTMIKFRVDIKQNGSVVHTFTVDVASATKLVKYSHEEEINVAGEFQIVFTNLSPSASTSNKDRTAIWDVEWTGCN